MRQFLWRQDWGGALPWLLGLAYAIAVAPLGLLDGTAGPLVLPTGDMNQYQGALRAFVVEPWHWPPFHASLPNAPDGVSLFETDSLPLLALLAKLWHSLTDRVPAALGIWIFLSYVLQPVAFAYLLRCLDVQGWLPLLAGGVMALSLPAFHFAFGHVALQAQWQITLALALALGSRDPERGTRRLILLALFAWAELWLNAYAFVMATGPLAGAWLDRLWQGRQDGGPPRRRLLLGALAWLAGVALLFQATGYGRIDGAAERSGFGHYSMNLVSPVIPQVSGLWPGFADRFVNPPNHNQAPLDSLGHPWRSLADMVDATGGQYEGYNYLGAGLLLLALLALAQPRRLGSLLAGRGGVTLAVVGLGAFALSNDVWLAYGRWFTLPEPPDLLQQFRSSGRFFWPLAYLLLALGLASAAARPRRLAAALLLLGATLQAADAWPWHWRAWWQLNAPQEALLDPAIWRPLVAAHRTILVVPPYHCRAPNREIGQALSYLAIEAGRPVNSYYLGRPPAMDCPAVTAALTAAPPQPGELYYLRDGIEGLRGIADPGFLASCRDFALGAVCTIDAAALDVAGFTALPSGKTPD